MSLLGGLWGGGKQAAAQGVATAGTAAGQAVGGAVGGVIPLPNYGAGLQSVPNVQYPLWQAAYDVIQSHKDVAHTYLSELETKGEWILWVKEARRLGVAENRGFFEPVPKCICPWCQLEPLQRAAALAAAEDTP